MVSPISVTSEYTVATDRSQIGFSKFQRIAATNDLCDLAEARYRADVRGLLNKVVVFIVLAAILNLLIAWGCATRPSPPVFDARLTADYRRARWQAEERGPQLRDDRLWIDRAYRGRGLHLLVIQVGPQGAEQIHIHRAGWPMASMEGREHNPITPGTVPIQKPSYKAAIPLPTDDTLLVPLVGGGYSESPYVRVLPLLPVWPGFAINTLVYAVGAILVAGLWWLARRALRKFRGRCLSCGYDLRRDYSTGCPECAWKRPLQTAW